MKNRLFSNRAALLLFTGNYRRLLFIMLLTAASQISRAQSCTVNAGISLSTCGTTTTLYGNVNGTLTGNANWSFVSGPVTPVIVNPASLTTNVTGMTVPGNYTFRVSQECTLGGTVFQDITVNANPQPVFTVGGSFSLCGLQNASVQTLTASPLPAGWTGKWTAADPVWGGDLTNLFTIADPTNPVTTVQLKPANQRCGGYYRFVWTITSPNGMCSYSKFVTGFYGIAMEDLEYEVIPKTICGPGTVAYNPLPGSCRFWGAYLPGYTITVLPVNVPAGFNGTLSGGTNASAQIITTGFSTPGTYTFKLRLNAPCGTKTWGTYTVTVLPKPEAATAVSGFNSFCLRSAPATNTFSFAVTDPSIVSTYTISGPGEVTVQYTGAGTQNRSIQLTPVGNWHPGTYSCTVNLQFPSGDGCVNSLTSSFWVSDESTPFPINMPTVSLCIPRNAATVSGDIQCPAYPSNIPVVAGSTWLFTKLEGPAGTPASVSAVAAPGATVRLTGLAAGNYTYKVTLGGTLGTLVACSGGIVSATFSIKVYNIQGSNAGTNQQVSCIQLHQLAGNTPVPPAFGTWSQVSGPSLMQFSNANDPNASVSLASNHAQQGTYIFRWTISDPNAACQARSSDVSITSSNGCDFLPLSKLEFTAVPKNGIAQLKWVTAAERNLRMYVVEWSNDGTNWRDAGTISPRGGNQDITYDFQHNPGNTAVNYYRLRVIEMDNSFTYSRIVSVRFDKTNVIEVLPNPAKDRFYVYNLKKGDNLQLLNMNGQPIKKMIADASTRTVEIAELPAGLYLLQVFHPGYSATETLRIIKQ